MIPKSAIPQATLARIRAVVEACLVGAGTPAAIRESTNFGERHVAYAVDAAQTLQLLVNKGRGKVSVTPLGRRLADAEPNSPQEYGVWRDAVATSPVLTEVAPDLLADSPPGRDQLAQRIKVATGLAASTSLQRAAMLLGWRKILQSQLPLPAVAVPRTGGMWRRIEIRNYRSIKHARVELAPFSLVVGPNGSGKSNFADALVFARDISMDASAAIESRGGLAGTRRWRPMKPTDVMIDIRAATSKRNLDRDYVRHFFKIHSGAQGHFSFTEEVVEVVTKGERRVWLSRSGDKLEKGGGGRLPELTETASAMVLVGQLKEFQRTSPLRNVRRYRLSPEEMRRPQLSSEKTRLEENGANIAVAVREVRRAGRFNELLKVMEHIVPGLNDIKVEPVGRFTTLKFVQAQEKGTVAEFNATEMSEGALRALGIVVATLQMAPDELLVIEEPEVSIHVGAAALLFEVLKEASDFGAVLVTTHSADLLDAAKDEEILVAEYQEGITAIGPLAKAQRDIVRKGLFSVAELMRSEPLRIERGRERPSQEKH